MTHTAGKIIIIALLAAFTTKAEGRPSGDNKDFVGVEATRFIADSMLTSFRQRDIAFVNNTCPWLTSDNGALLTLANSSAAEAQATFSFEEGDLRNYDGAKRNIKWGGKAQAYVRLSPILMTYGSMEYQSNDGHQMTGSAFIDTRRLPFDLVEDSLANPGRKHKDTYKAEAAIGVQPLNWLAAGAKFNFTAANMAKYKDLRHKTTLMDLTLTLGATARHKAVTIGGDFYYRRNSQSVNFSTYGKSDKDYITLIDYGIFSGQTERFGAEGFTDKSLEQPLITNNTGGGAQIKIDITPQLNVFAEIRATSISGYYGKKSPYTITYSEHDGNALKWTAAVTLRLTNSMHTLKGGFEKEKLANNITARKTLENEYGAYHYEYYTPVKAADKQWTTANADYIAYFGKNLQTSVTAGVNILKRKQTVYYYPLLRRQDIGNTEGHISIEHNILLRKSRLTLQAGGSYRKGYGDIYSQETFQQAPATTEETQIPTMTEFLNQEYQYLTEPQYSVGGSVRYTFAPLPKQPKLMLYTEAAAKYANNKALGDRYAINISIGCNL